VSISVTFLFLGETKGMQILRILQHLLSTVFDCSSAVMYKVISDVSEQLYCCCPMNRNLQPCYSTL